MKKCLGCGRILQYIDKNSLGYTEKEENNLCERCFKLKNYGKYQKVNLTNKDYQEILKTIPDDSLVLYITDVLTLDCLSLNKFKKVILVVTKKDILPKSTKSEKIINYLKKRYPSILDIHVTSSKTEEGISSLYHQMIKESNDKKVYLVGTTNSGKSSLINKLINLYGTENNNSVTVSMYPSTTLDKIEIHLDKITLVDTPGLINETNIVHYLKDTDVKKITPKKEIKPKSCQIEGKGSLMIDNYARIDYNTKKRNSMVIYTSNNLKIRFASLKSDIHHDLSKHNLSLSEGQDIVIPGLGFIKCVGKIDITVYTLNGVIPIIRENLI